MSLAFAALSVGSVGALGDALAETHIGLFKTELIRSHGPWEGLDDVNLATLECDCSGRRRDLAFPLVNLVRTSKGRRPCFGRGGQVGGHRGEVLGAGEGAQAAGHLSA